MTHLTRESVDFARNHVSAFWDSDFFPKAFEFYALWAHWDEVADYLTETDINDLQVVLPRTIPAPKPDGSYRIVHQLDLLNTLAYTAMAYLIAEGVERARPDPDLKIACSYRIALDAPAGKFFGEGSGFGDFVEQSRVHAEAYSYVLVADITDFYNQIYQHRLQNAISSASPALIDIANDIERFLRRLNDGVSHGVPVGPAASIIMSEAVLLDIDDFVLSSRFEHTRYVDDFRVFSNSQSDLRALHQDLTAYLHANHRLVLASRKTEIIEAREFLDTVLDDPEEIERREIHAALQQIGPINGYDFQDDEPDNLPDDVGARAEVMQELMDRVCSLRPLDLGLARHVLRRCRRYKIRAIVPQLLAHFDFFAPVMNDVVLYLDAVINHSFLERHGAILQHLFQSDGVQDRQFARYWISHLIVRNAHLWSREEFAAVVMNGPDLEHQAHLAMLQRNVAWVRTHRARIDELASWSRRQILRASQALSRDERRHWLRNVQANNPTGIERWLLRWLIAMS